MYASPVGVVTKFVRSRLFQVLQVAGNPSIAIAIRRNAIHFAGASDGDECEFALLPRDTTIFQHSGTRWANRIKLLLVKEHARSLENAE